MPLALKIAIGVAILGLVGAALLGIVAAIAVPALLRARMAGNEASAVAVMRSINSAQFSYASSCAGGLYARSLTVLGKAPSEGGSAFLSSDLARADRTERSGYAYWIDAPPLRGGRRPACNGAEAPQLSESFVARAEPLTPRSGRRYFATTEKGVVYARDDGPVAFGSDGTADPPAVPLQ